MKKRIFKALFMVMLFTTMFSINVLAADETQEDSNSPEIETSTSSYRRTEYLTASTDYNFDSSHSIHIEACVYVDYEWDEGYYGWINFACSVDEHQGNYTRVSSSNINIPDPPTCTHSDYDTENQYHEEFYFCGTGYQGSNVHDYTGYIKIYVSVDEWGEVDVWIKFEESGYKGSQL